MELEQLERDVEAIEQGTWITDIPGVENLRLLVRGLNSRKYQAAITRMQRSATRKDKDAGGNLKSEAAALILGKALHEVILLDWDGLTEKGENLKFDKKRAYQLLTDPRFRPFQDAVVAAAQQVDNTGIMTTEDLTKNFQEQPLQEELSKTTTEAPISNSDVGITGQHFGNSQPNVQ